MNKKIMRFFGWDILIAVVGLILLYYIGGLTALWIGFLLMLLEITLSFDNAVVNAKVLEQMTEKWKKRFITWGIAIAVFGTRFVLPIVIVSIVAGISPWGVASMAIFDASQYGMLLDSTKFAIHSFGAAFLLMVALKYFFDRSKKVHWFVWLEKKLSHWGYIESLEIIIVLAGLVGMSYLVPQFEQFTVLVSGILGVILFIVMHGITSMMSLDTSKAGSMGLAAFIYLEILDASFSLDGVIGAFALTNSILVIVIGLGVGAVFVRSLTLYMVKEKTLNVLRYLEHGAHWAIFALALSMFVSLIHEVPEVVTGTIGIAFVLFAYISSIRVNKKERTKVS